MGGLAAGAAVPALDRRCEQLLELFAAVPARPVAHSSVFEALRWVLRSHGGSGGAPAPQAKAAMLRALVQDAVFHWHDAQWRNGLATHGGGEAGRWFF